MRPSKLTLSLALVFVGLAVAVSFFPSYRDVYLLSVVLVITVLLFDLRSLLGRVNKAPLKIERNSAAAMSLGVWHEVSLAITNSTAGAQSIDVWDHHPNHCEIEGLPQSVVVPGNRQSLLHYRLKPLRRGVIEFPCCEVRYYSPLQLWTKNNKHEIASSAKIYPNIAQVTQYALWGLERQISQVGVRLQRRRGEGSDFQQLRDYRQGDTFRQIDWKASARHRKLIAKEYRDERDQQVVIVMDSGRRMLTEEQGLSHFDHALNAALILSYIAVKQGDAVGFMSMADEPHWMAPQKGRVAVKQMLEHVFALHAQPITVDYHKTVKEILARQRRRSLIVFVTNVRDEDVSSLNQALRVLERHHLVLLVSLREKELDERLNEDVDSFHDAIRFASTQHYLAARRKVLSGLAGGRRKLWDVHCDALPRTVTEGYLQVKRAGLL